MKAGKTLPGDKCLDNTLKLLLEGYLFIPNRCLKYQSDLFTTRLFGQKVVCMSSAEAAKKFYDNKYFTRKGVAPKRIQKTLFGEKGVQTLDGFAHKHRKALFLSIMAPEKIEKLVNLTCLQWEKDSRCWERKGSILLFDEVQKLLSKVSCQWAGVPLNRYEVALRAADFGAMVDAFGGVGPRYWKGKCARIRAQQWLSRIIEEVRSNRLHAPVGSALHDIAWHYDVNGCLLDIKTAAVELINVLRPIVAIATYITFGAMALHRNPEYLPKLQAKDNAFARRFTQEVRRYYPFAPFVGARVRRDFRWNHYDFKKNTLVLLDLYGINHDPRLWVLPDRFLPDRFLHRHLTPYDFIPHGGGNIATNHRCAGEEITIRLIQVSMQYLANHLEYFVPLQDLNFSLMRMPTLPASKFKMVKIKRINKLNKN